MVIARFAAEDDKGNHDFSTQGVVQVLSDSGFMYLFQKRLSDDIWKSIMCVQTNIKSQIGIGYPIHIDFYAPLDITDPEKPIEYDFRSIGEDIHLIQTDEE